MPVNLCSFASEDCMLSNRGLGWLTICQPLQTPVAEIMGAFFPRLRIDPTQFRRFGDAGHGQQIRAHAQIRLLLPRLMTHGIV